MIAGDNIAQSDFKQLSPTALSHERSRWCNADSEFLTPAAYATGVFLFLYTAICPIRSKPCY